MKVFGKPLLSPRSLLNPVCFIRNIERTSQTHVFSCRGHLFRPVTLLSTRKKYDTFRPCHPTQAREIHSLIKTGEPTIYALSTAPGRAAIAIIRISGPACLTVYRALCPWTSLPKPRYATLRTLFEPSVTLTDIQDPEVLDSDALIFYFPAPHTATGEDILELHVHGGTAVVRAVLSAIPKTVQKDSLSKIRYAEPGEFTRRAFYNNRLDLVQVEALGDTLTAETEQQRRLAVRGSTTVLAGRYEEWRQKLLYARGELEALIDFSEDQHFDETPANLCTSVLKQVSQLTSHLRTNIESASRGELLRNGISIALIGAPNAGKSSLLNQIVGREAAIVSSEAGTTRDVVDVNVDIGGFYCRFGDLAGLRNQRQDQWQQIGEIEKEGIRRAKERALKADVVIIVLAPETVMNSANSNISVSIGSEVQEMLKLIDLNSQKVVCVLNKADLFVSRAHLSATRSKFRRHRALRDVLDLSETPLFAISCTNARESNIDNESDPSGIRSLLDGLTQIFRRMTAAVVPREHDGTATDSAWAESLGATERQRLLLQQCLQYLETFVAEVQCNDQSAVTRQEDDIDVVLAAESLRSAADCLAKITGRGESGDVEEVLGVVFEK